jgi:hypothetical protein
MSQPPTVADWTSHGLGHATIRRRCSSPEAFVVVGQVVSGTLLCMKPLRLLRPRFTLRVALVVTAIVAYVAWQVGMVQQRKTTINGTHVFVMARGPATPGGSEPRVNPIRALLGDEPVRFVYIVPIGDYEQDAERLANLFPEASVKPIEDRRAFD